MINFIEDFLQTMRPAFSRKATFVWFVIAFAGFVVRSDLYGVTSIVRTLLLDPKCYPCLKPSSRKPKRNDKTIRRSSNPKKTQNTLEAIEKFIHVQMLVMGMLQLLARQFAKDVHARPCCWLRTPCGEIPSEFVTRTALSNIIRAKLAAFGQDTITRFIRKKQNIEENAGVLEDVA